MEEYFKTKCKLFNYLDPEGTAVLNWDDPKIKPLAQKLNCNVLTCGLEEGAMIRVENIREVSSQQSAVNSQKIGGLGGMSFDIKTPKGGFTINSSLIGRFNVYNILMSAGIAYSLGISEDVIQQGIHNTKPVEGRFENIDEGQRFLCIVDYAHTDDAMKKLIQEARHLTQGRVITVFGCGGNRDRTKRPLMGAAATELSDFAVITSDNPRNEDPLDIIKDILKGISKNNYSVQPDRTEAIKEAVAMASEGDTVLVAGKGHEDYQEIKGARHHFSDKEVLREEIKKLLAISYDRGEQGG
jgi:UDP-N-acetylmuramoyl-L-alanyl-D-glutamate--2,6-diaminopimelate ligase